MVVFAGRSWRYLHLLLTSFLQGQKFMLQAFRCSDSVIWVQCQHFPQKIQSALIHIAVLGHVETEVHLPVALEHCLWIASTEEISTHQQNMKNHSSRENVTLRRNLPLILLFDDFRREVARSAASLEHNFILPSVDSQSKVNNSQFQSLLFPHHNILQLDIPMRDLILLQLSQSLHYAPHYRANFFKFEVGLSMHEVFQKIASFQHLQNHIVAVIGLEDSLQFQQVAMIECPQDVDLILETVKFLRVVFQNLLREHLGCHSFSVFESNDLVDCCGTAFAQLFDRPELLMETKLIDVLSQEFHPDAGQLSKLDVEGNCFSIFVDESESLELLLGVGVGLGSHIFGSCYFLKFNREVQFEAEGWTTSLF